MGINIQELTIENIGIWPESVKYGAVTIFCVVLLFLGYWIDIKGLIAKVSTLENTENDLKLQIDVKYQEVGNLPSYKEQLLQMQQNFKTMLRKLPGATEIPGLLEDISKIGRSNGLEFKWFKPGQEKTLEFYAELPIRIGVVGSYHQLANFVSQVSAMDRIVTLDDFTIGPLSVDKSAKKTSGDESQSIENPTTQLMMEITAKTYRYNDEQKTTTTTPRPATT